MADSKDGESWSLGGILIIAALAIGGAFSLANNLDLRSKLAVFESQKTEQAEREANQRTMNKIKQIVHDEITAALNAEKRDK